MVNGTHPLKKGFSINSRIAMSHFAQSLQEFEDLYKELAK